MASSTAPEGMSSVPPLSTVADTTSSSAPAKRVAPSNTVVLTTIPDTMVCGTVTVAPLLTVRTRSSVPPLLIVAPTSAPPDETYSVPPLLTVVLLATPPE